LNIVRKFLECLFVWNVSPTEIIEPDVILAHGVGDHEDGTPGPINQEMAVRIREFCSEHPGLSILAQGEVGQCLTGLKVQIVVPRQRDRTGKYIDTKDVAQSQYAACKKGNWSRPVLFTWRPHVLRARQVTEKVFGIKVMIPDGLPKRYDKDNSQIWLRNPFVALPRELAARMLYLFKGLI